MRANVNLDTDAYGFASAYASAKGIPLGAAISELLRRAEQTPEPPVSASSKLKRDKHGLLVVAKTGTAITPEMVKEASEDDLV
jgi:phosphoribosylaminoimidazole-succinocarboxamide synthase